MSTTELSEESPLVPTLTRWLSQHEVSLKEPVQASAIMGGQSNLTYRIVDATGRTLVLRRPPTGHVLETAHSMIREWRFISALHGTDVPVPAPIAFCDDQAVLGAPFYVMEHVDGLVLHSSEDSLALPSAARPNASAGIATALGHLHSVNAEAAGLADIGRGGDYVARQLKRWHGQWEKTKAIAELDVPAIDEGHVLLQSAIPPQESISIVHGDYRLGNVVTGSDGTIRAILDWELATLGDPRADLGWLLLSWEEPGESRLRHPAGQQPSTVPGFGSRAELIEHYAQQMGGQAVTGIDYFIAFAAWRWACISAGVYARYQAGVMGAEVGDLPAILAAVREHADYAVRLGAAHGGC